MTVIPTMLGPTTIRNAVVPQVKEELVRAAVLSPDPLSDPIEVVSWPEPEVPAGWVLVRLVRAALNRLDAMTVDGRAALGRPSVIGSDGAGVVVALGERVEDVRLGSHVVISPSLWWGESQLAPGPRYEILGSPTDGTHAELVAVPAENVFPKPARLSWDEVAALPLAGLTAWRALVTRGRLRAGETVVVTAASSGVGTFAIQIATALGARVVAVSSSNEKLVAAEELGAAAGVLRTSLSYPDELKHAVGDGVDLVIEPTGAGWPDLLHVMKPGGRLVSLGRMVTDEATLPVRSVFWKQVDILGSSMGSPTDFAALLAHLDGAEWAPAVDSVFPLARIRDAYRRLDSPERIGKVLIDLE